MRFGVIAALVVWSAPVSADPADHLEASAFFGVDKLSDRISLGRPTDGSPVYLEQAPQTAPMFGARLTYLPLKTERVGLGAEAQLSFAPAWTGYGFDGPRASYFSPIFGYRANAILRIGTPALRLHLVGGAGGATVATTSPFMKDETDAVFFWGPGATIRMAPRWQMRVDLHQAFLPAMGGGSTTTYELQVGVSTTFGKLPIEPRVQVEVAQQDKPRPPAPEIDYDSDGDGVPDKLDRCPNQPGTADDGCAPPDPDGDGIIGAADKCPDKAEDFDHFQDDDGCPEPDNDGDGILDAKDACPNQPETKNGFEDDDGCPDQIPANLTAALAGAGKVRFEPAKARLTAPGKTALEPALTLLRSHPAMRVVITGHAETEELAKKRADVVKWYLVDQGVAADQIDTVAGAAGPATIQMTLAK